MKKTILSLACFLTVLTLLGQSPKRELRATWIASVSRIDWPKSTTSSVQQQELISIFDKLQQANMNTAFLQMRPMCDALYNSQYEPWSQYLTGTRGKDPGYDPLDFAIKEAHKRGLELHAWLNPYRYESTPNSHGANDFIRKNHPEWLLDYSAKGKGIILDPGNPEVRAYIISVIEDIITNYNVDGVIFDDYFYPYGGTHNEDAYSQERYKDPNKNVGDWRRECINELMADTYQMIQEKKPTVKFGVGPFGIWGGTPTVATEYGIDYLDTDSRGGTNAYSSIYCDGVAWMKEKSIDYISPQCYWPSFNTNPWGYTILVPWWAQVAKTMGRHFYSSMRISTMAPSTQSPQGLKRILDEYNITEQEFQAFSMLEQAIVATVATREEECGLEVDLNRSTDQMGAPGHVFFNTTQFFSYGLNTYLKNNKFTQPALTPVMTWKSAQPLPALSNIKLEYNQLSWTTQADETYRFAAYLVPNDVADDPNSYTTSTYLQKTTWNKTIDVSAYQSQLATHTFGITVIDAHGNESNPYKAQRPTGIEQSDFDTFHIYGGTQSIHVTASQETILKIYAVTGQLIQTVQVTEGETTIPITSGMYIVNGKKVAVR